MTLSGNKGEWSEIYVFLKLLATGRLYAADSDLNKIDDVFILALLLIPIVMYLMSKKKTY